LISFSRNQRRGAESLFKAGRRASEGKRPSWREPALKPEVTDFPDRFWTPSVSCWPTAMALAQAQTDAGTSLIAGLQGTGRRLDRAGPPPRTASSN